MRSAECGMDRTAVVHPGWLLGSNLPRNSALRTPHSALACASEVRLPIEPTALAAGRFGPYGGRYVPETLMAALEELERVYDEAKGDPRFWAELDGRSEERRVGKECATLC